MGSRELFSVPSIDELYSQTSQAVLPTMAESISQPILKTPSQPSQESSGSQERSAINSVRRLRFQETVEEKTISEEPLSDEPDSMEVDAIGESSFQEEEEEVEAKVEKHDESVYLSPNASFEDEEETEKEVQKLTESAVEEKEELKEDDEKEKEEEEKEEEKDDDLTPQVDKREEYEEILSDDMNELQ